MSADAVSAEMAEHVIALGGNGRSVKEAIWVAARRTGLSAGQIKRLRYGEWQVIPAYIADTVRAARRKENERLRDAARKEYETLEARIARLEAVLQDVDADRAGPA